MSNFNDILKKLKEDNIEEKINNEFDLNTILNQVKNRKNIPYAEYNQVKEKVNNFGELISKYINSYYKFFPQKRCQAGNNYPYLGSSFRKSEQHKSYLELVFDDTYTKPMYRVSLGIWQNNTTDEEFKQYNSFLNKDAPNNMVYWTGKKHQGFWTSDNPISGRQLMTKNNTQWVGLGRYLTPEELKEKTSYEVFEWTLKTLYDLEPYYDLATGITKIQKETKQMGETKYFCEVFGRKLLEYKNNRKELIQRINHIYAQTQNNLTTDYSKTGFNKIESDISPIQALALFMPQTNDIFTLQDACKNEFNLPSFYNEDFYPFPLVIPFIDKNFILKYVQFNKLWDLLEIAITYYDNPTNGNKNKFIYNYNIVRQQINNGKPTSDFKITRALYWMFPEFYLTLDSNTRFYLYDNFAPNELPIFFSIFKLNKHKEFIFNGATLPDGETYLKIIDEIRALIETGNTEFKSFMELSDLAYDYNPDLVDENNNEDESEDDETMKTDVELNTILYGPPGTGKTHHTPIYAVAICENKPLEEIKSLTDKEIKEKYEYYKKQGRINFVTFHQSYGYEEFIEGIKPVLPEEGEEYNELKYELSKGIFKAFCEKARTIKTKEDESYGLNNSPVVWKVSLEKTGDNDTRKECMENNHIRIGWDKYGEDLPEKYDEGGKNVLDSFYNKMKIGDLVLSCYSAETIDAIGVVTGECEWHPNYEKYKRLRNVRWLVKDINVNITDLNNGAVMAPSTVYMMDISAGDVLKIVKSQLKDKQADSKADEKMNYVFIIDEINRGNISKIFGELITLIEDKKRLGADEQMTVTLPYSPKKAFGVPNNVYILGTMNTADRSIALLDTALRRRFNFIEMMPEPELLGDIKVYDKSNNDTGINLVKMLQKINDRIEVLLDRDHTIGHSYFLKLKDDPSLKNLRKIFENNIIPLLQEYFYDDFEKIQLVLNDKIIKIEDFDKGLFKGNSDIIEGKKLYKIDTDALDKIDSYIEIYESKTKTDDGAKVDGE